MLGTMMVKLFSHLDLLSKTEDKTIDMERFVLNIHISLSDP